MLYRRMNNNQYQDEEEYYGRYQNPNGVYHYERPLRGISRHNTQSDGIILPVIFFMGIMFFGVMVFGLVHFGVFSNDASTTTGKKKALPKVTHPHKFLF